MVPPLTLCAYMKKGPNLRWSLIQCSGGDEGDRTPDLLTASQALSQLSYAPVRKSTIRELERRCKDIFGKTSGGAGWQRDGAVPDPRPGAGKARPRPDHARGARPAGRPPRKPPIYYVRAASPDHSALDKIKTAGRRPAVLSKSGVWSRGPAKT